MFPEVHALLLAVGKRTGLPALINTSLECSFEYDFLMMTYGLQATHSWGSYPGVSTRVASLLSTQPLG